MGRYKVNRDIHAKEDAQAQKQICIVGGIATFIIVVLTLVEIVVFALYP